MVFKTAKKLKRLENKQLLEDIKKFIKYSHTFYETQVPELEVLAKRLHQEYSLKEFYGVFNKFWKSGRAREMSLALYTLQLYKDDFDLITWGFIKQKLREIRSWDKIDSVAIHIMGEILIKNPVISRELINFSRGKNLWFKRAAIMSTIPLVKDKDFRLALEVIDQNLYDKSEHIQKAIGIVLKEIGEIKEDVLRRYIKDNINMPVTVFFVATENHKELRNLRESNKENNKGKKAGNFVFWR